MFKKIFLLKPVLLFVSTVMLMFLVPFTTHPFVYADSTVTCLTVNPKITPSRIAFPFNEILQISVSNGCGVDLPNAQLQIIDKVRCGSNPWVTDYTNSVNFAVNAGQTVTPWTITGVQTGCPSGENGPFQQWLHGDASSQIGGTTYTGSGDGYLNTGF